MAAKRLDVASHYQLAVPPPPSRLRAELGHICHLPDRVEDHHRLQREPHDHLLLGRLRESPESPGHEQPRLEPGCRRYSELLLDVDSQPTELVSEHSPALPSVDEEGAHPRPRDQPVDQGCVRRHNLPSPPQARSRE